MRPVLVPDKSADGHLRDIGLGEDSQDGPVGTGVADRAGVASDERADIISAGDRDIRQADVRDDGSGARGAEQSRARCDELRPIDGEPVDDLVATVEDARESAPAGDGKTDRAEARAAAVELASMSRPCAYVPPRLASMPCRSATVLTSMNAVSEPLPVTFGAKLMALSYFDPPPTAVGL